MPQKKKPYYSMVAPQQSSQIHIWVWAVAECTEDFSVEIIWEANFEEQSLKQQILSMAMISSNPRWVSELVLNCTYYLVQ